MSVRNY